VNKVAKWGVGLGIVGLLGYAISQGAKKLGNVSYSIKGFGLPTLAGTTVTVPIIIHFNNPSPVAVTITRLQIWLSFLQGNNWVQAGTLDQSNLVLPSGESDITVKPVADLKALFSNVLSTITTALINKAVKIKADVTITMAGLSASHSLTKDVTIK